MADRIIETNASRNAFEAAFENAFLARTKAADYFKLNQRAVMRRKTDWRVTRVDGADIAVVLESAGAGLRAQSGVSIAAEINDRPGMLVAHMWMPAYLERLGMDASYGLVKNYAKWIASDLQSEGYTASVSKVR